MTVPIIPGIDDARARPNPGSDAAIDAGCICPVIDNGHGWGTQGREGLFWKNLHCPLHGLKTEEGDDE